MPGFYVAGSVLVGDAVTTLTGFFPQVNVPNNPTKRQGYISLKFQSFIAEVFHSVVPTSQPTFNIL